MIRKLSLQEWFLIYQLQKIENNHAHLPFILKVDTSALECHFKENVPYTTVLVKAASLWQEVSPITKKQVFNTIFGLRLYENHTGNVNVPILLDHEGTPYMSVMTIKNAKDKSLLEIQNEFSQYSKSNPKELFIGSKMLGKKNNFFNRSRLKLIHFIVNNFPQIQEKYEVGTTSVSSLLKFSKPEVNLITTAKGPGAFSLCVSSIDRVKNKLELGISWDHQTGDGHEAAKACYQLAEILQGQNSDLFKRLIT